MTSIVSVYRRLILTVMFLLIASFFTACSDKPLSLDESLAHAQALNEEGKPNEAIQTLEKALELYPDDTTILEALSFAYADQKQHREAAFYFRQLAGTSDEYWDYLLYAAKSYIEAGDNKSAAIEYSHYLEKRPEDSTSWKAYAETTEKLGQSENSINAYLKSYEIKPSGEVALNLGRNFRRAGNGIQAEKWLQKALPFGGDIEAQTLVEMIELGIDYERFEAAEKVIAVLDRKHPGFLDVTESAGRRKELQAWREKQEQVVAELAEQERIAREMREKAELERKAKEEEARLAKEAAEMALREQEELAALEEVTEAEEEAREAIIDPSEPISVESAEIGVIVPESAVINSNPDLAALINEAESARENGNTQKAILAYRQACLIDDTRADIWYELSRLFHGDKQYAWAESHALEAIRRDPSNVRYRLQLLQSAQHTRPPQRFFEELLKARELFPNSPEIAFALAQGYQNIEGNTRNAILLYKEFLQRAPGHPRADRARQELRKMGASE